MCRPAQTAGQEGEHIASKWLDIITQPAAQPASSGRDLSHWGLGIRPSRWSRPYIPPRSTHWREMAEQEVLTFTMTLAYSRVGNDFFRLALWRTISPDIVGKQDRVGSVWPEKTGGNWQLPLTLGGQILFGQLASFMAALHSWAHAPSGPTW